MHPESSNRDPLFSFLRSRVRARLAAWSPGLPRPRKTAREERGDRKTIAGTLRDLLPWSGGANARSHPSQTAAPVGLSVLGFKFLSFVEQAEGEFFDKPDPSFPDLRPLLRPGALVLDMGCGRGRNLEHLEVQGFRAIALDCNANHLAHVRAAHRADVVQADMFNLPFEDAHVEAIVAWQVFCQFSLPSVQLLFDEMHRVLTSEGLLILAGCYGCAPSHSALPGERVVDACPILPPTFDPVRTQILEPVPGWPRLRWLYLARKAGPSKVHESVRSASSPS